MRRRSDWAVETKSRKGLSEGSREGVERVGVSRREEVGQEIRVEEGRSGSRCTKDAGNQTKRGRKR